MLLLPADSLVLALCFCVPISGTTAPLEATDYFYVSDFITREMKPSLTFSILAEFLLAFYLSSIIT